jgi:hypothetical protein
MFQVLKYFQGIQKIHMKSQVYLKFNNTVFETPNYELDNLVDVWRNILA